MDLWLAELAHVESESLFYDNRPRSDELTAHSILLEEEAFAGLGEDESFDLYEQAMTDFHG